MVLAVSAAHRGDNRHTRLWLTTTALLGATFVGGQVYEFTAFYREGLGFTTNLFGSSFYTLTGFHGAHVTIGIIMLMSLVVITFRGRISGTKAEVIELIGLYWHFVDIVWIVIFTLVYLIPVLMASLVFASARLRLVAGASLGGLALAPALAHYPRSCS